MSGVRRDTSADALAKALAPELPPDRPFDPKAAAALWLARIHLRDAIEKSDRILARLARHTKLTFSEKAAIREARERNVVALAKLMAAEGIQTSGDGG